MSGRTSGNGAARRWTAPSPSPRRPYSASPPGTNKSSRGRCRSRRRDSPPRPALRCRRSGRSSRRAPSVSACPWVTSEGQGVHLNLIDQRGARNAELLGGPGAVAAVEAQGALDVLPLDVRERQRQVAPLSPAAPPPPPPPPPPPRPPGNGRPGPPARGGGGPRPGPPPPRYAGPPPRLARPPARPRTGP